MSAPSPTLALTPLTPADLDAAVDLHSRLLPHGFFVGLGPHFLRRYYRTFLDSPYAWTACAQVDGTLVAALVGTLDAEAHRRHVSEHLPVLAVAGAAALAVRPAMLRRFLGTRVSRYARGLGRRLVPQLHHRARGRAPRGGQRIAVLNHVYVDESLRGDGVGSRLVDEFLTAARTAGATRAELVTLADDAGAGEFYRRNGWRQVRRRPNADGRLVEVYARAL